jgi:hypothetical protein
MSVEEMPDPILRALANVRPIAPSVVHDDRVRARCHDVLVRRRRVRDVRAKAVDVVLAAAVAIYAAIGVTEAAWLVFRSG